MRVEKLLKVVEQARLGDDKAFALLMQSKAKNVLFIALSIMEDSALAEDAAQDAMITMREKITTLKHPEAFDSWMYRVVYNTCMYELRKMKRVSTHNTVPYEELELAEDRSEFLPEDSLFNEVRRAELKEAIGQLPHTYRMCLILYYYEDMSYAQIADTMDINVQDVANVLNRAKKKLRTKLESSEASESGFALQGTQTTQKMGVAAGVPILSQFFASEADTLVTPLAIERFNEAVLTHIATPVGAATATATAAAASSTGFLSTTASKLVAAAVGVVLVLGVGGIVITQGGSDDTPFFGASQTQQNSASAQEETVSSAEVIGEENAQQLEQATSQPQDSGSWKDFARNAGFLYVEHVLDREYRYDVYQAVNEETGARTVAITRSNDAGSVEVATRSGSSNMALPQGTNIVASFNAWH